MLRISCCPSLMNCCFKLNFSYVIVGDARGLIRFFDKDMKLLRWTNNFFLKSVHCISFNINDELPQFKKELRDKFDKNSGDYIKKVDQSRVRDYSMGGTKDRELSMTTIERPPMPCTDFVFSMTLLIDNYSNLKLDFTNNQ